LDKNRRKVSSNFKGTKEKSPKEKNTGKKCLMRHLERSNEESKDRGKKRQRPVLKKKRSKRASSRQGRTLDLQKGGKRFDLGHALKIKRKIRKVNEQKLQNYGPPRGNL